MESIELSKFIEELRDELSRAMRAGADAELRFVAKSIDLELQVAAETKKDGSGKLSFRVFGIGAEGGGGLATSATVTHKLQLSLDLVDADGERPFIRAISRASDTL